MISMEESVRELVNLEFKIQSRIFQFQETSIITQKEIYDTNSEIKGLFVKLDSKIQELIQIGEEQDDEQQKVNILKDAQRHTNEIQSLRSLLKAANIKANTNRQHTYETERNQFVNDGVRKRHTTTNDDLVEDSQRVNTKMKGIRDGMLNLTDQGTAINQRLEFSSQLISGVLTDQEEMGDKLKSAEKLMHSYKMINLTSNFMIGLAIIFYFCVCLYIIIARFPVPIGSLYRLLVSFWGDM